jgi:hypothetical protein
VDAAQTYGAAGSVGLAHSLLMCFQEAPKSNGRCRDQRFEDKAMYINELPISGKTANRFRQGLNQTAIAAVCT